MLLWQNDRAAWILRALAGFPRASLKVDVTRCACGCGRRVTPGRRYFGPGCYFHHMAVLKAEARERRRYA